MKILVDVIDSQGIKEWLEAGQAWRTLPLGETVLRDCGGCGGRGCDFCLDRGKVWVTRLQREIRVERVRTPAELGRIAAIRNVMASSAFGDVESKVRPTGDRDV